jgi:hypothetical protein
VIALSQLVDPSLLPEWENHLRDFASKGWVNRVKVTGLVAVERVERAAPAGTVVVRIRTTVEDCVVTQDGGIRLRSGQRSPSGPLEQDWAVALRGTRLQLVSIL